MALQITDDETCQQAAELAKLTGESTAQAIAAAVRERLQREQQERDRQAFFDRVHEISARVVKLAEESPAKGFTDDDLYDEHGLPK